MDKKQLLKISVFFVLFLCSPCFADKSADDNIQIEWIDSFALPLLRSEILDDYRLMREVFKKLSTHTPKPIIVKFRTKDEKAEGYGDGSFTIYVKPSNGRGSAIHELMHVFAYQLNDPSIKEEFLCVAAENIANEVPWDYFRDHFKCTGEICKEIK